jgi:hypothetical protein
MDLALVRPGDRFTQSDDFQPGSNDACHRGTGTRPD